MQFNTFLLNKYDILRGIFQTGIYEYLLAFFNSFQGQLCVETRQFALLKNLPERMRVLSRRSSVTSFLEIH